MKASTKLYAQVTVLEKSKDALAGRIVNEMNSRDGGCKIAVICPKSIGSNNELPRKIPIGKPGSMALQVVVPKIIDSLERALFAQSAIRIDHSTFLREPS